MALDEVVIGTFFLTYLVGPPITSTGTRITWYSLDLGPTDSAPGLGRAASAPLWTLGWGAFLGLAAAAGGGVGLVDADWAALLGLADSAPRLALTAGGLATLAAGFAFGLAPLGSLNFLW